MDTMSQIELPNYQLRSLSTSNSPLPDFGLHHHEPQLQQHQQFFNLASGEIESTGLLSHQLEHEDNNDHEHDTEYDLEHDHDFDYDHENDNHDLYCYCSLQHSRELEHEKDFEQELEPCNFGSQPESLSESQSFQREQEFVESDRSLPMDHESQDDIHTVPIRQRSSSISSTTSSTSPSRKAQRIWQCDRVGCYKVFTSLVGFRYHMKRGHIVETKKRDKICPIEGCRRSFASYQGLNYHLQNHTKQDISKQEGVVIISSSSVEQKQLQLQLQQQQQQQRQQQQQQETTTKSHSSPRRSSHRHNSVNSTHNQSSSSTCPIQQGLPSISTTSILSNSTLAPSPLSTTTSITCSSNLAPSFSSSASPSSFVDMPGLPYFSEDLDWILNCSAQLCSPQDSASSSLPKPFADFETLTPAIF